jgi:Uma2 family endonuclease
MVAVPRDRWISPEEYLEWEGRAETKSEYFDGVIVAMAGTSAAHNTIAFNVGGVLHAQLRGGPCRGLTSDQRVRISAGNSYVYPDVVIVCGEPRFEIVKGLESLLNPTVVIEVLSDSTERRDRVVKFDGYRTIESLQSVLFVAQDRPRVECYTRERNSWRYDAATRKDASIAIAPISSTLALAEVYDNIEFPAPELELVPDPEPGR